MSRPYSTDLTDQQWAIIEPLLPPPRPRGHRPSVDPRRVLDAILYQTKNACTWRDLPRAFPNHTTVYRYFEQWRDDGTLAALYEALHRRWRREAGREEDPSAGAVDRRSVQATSEAAERGSDPKKKVVGRKQHLCVDTEGFPLSIELTSASANDKAAAYGLLERAVARSPRLKKLWADGAYVSAPLEDHAEAHGVDFEVVGRPERASERGFIVIPRRGVVERTFAWLKRCRRLIHDVERLAPTVEAFIYLALSRLLLNRLAPRS